MNNADSTAAENSSGGFALGKCDSGGRGMGDELKPHVGFITLWFCGVADDVVVKSGAL